MSKRTENIIKSPEAEAFLQMVTKGFYADSYMGLWIFEVIGREWDEMRSWAEGLKNEIHPQTCTWSVAIWEWVYDIETDESMSLELRRQRIFSKIIAVKPCNPETIRNKVAALIGADSESVEVDENAGPYQFDVILHPSDAPFPYSMIAPYIREIKPSHLRFEAIVETKVAIRIKIEAKGYPYRTGLTGEYNAGTRPRTNVKARLEDLVIAVSESASGAVFTAQSAGTTYATAAGTNTQVMASPSILFGQSEVEIGADLTAEGNITVSPMTSESSGAGTYPATQETFSQMSGGVTPTIETESYQVSYRMCGTGVTTNQ